MPIDQSRGPAQKIGRRRRRGGILVLAGRAIAILIMIGIITGCIVASVLTVYVLNTLDASDRVQLDTVKMSFTTILYAQQEDTDEYFELQRVQNNENRIWVDYADIPQCVKDAAVAVEDKRFWAHSGIDLQRTVAAAVNYANPFADDFFGGSTITQQVIKNITQDNEFDVGRKVREIFRAINLEKNYSKDQILEAYLNTIALGNGQNGVQSASNLYFGKDVRELTPAEAASLIAITQNPTKWNPFTSPDNNRDRQMMVLQMMRDQQRPDGSPMLTEEQYEQAVVQDMVFKKDEYVQTLDTVQNWFIDTVYEEVLADLVSEAGYTEAGAREALRTGGFRIYTTVDAEMQSYLEEKYLDPATFPTIRNTDYPESAFVILDLQGQVKAIAGSNQPKEGARVFNRATSAVRHPGSTIKPLASYSLAVEYDMIHWSMVWEDSPILLNPEDPESTYPRNFYLNPPYRGPITITEAVQRSTNTIPVKLVQMLSPKTSFTFMRDSLGFSHLVESETRGGRVFTDIDLAPMALGGLTDGATPLEMAAGYQMFGNGGMYYKPHSYTKVLDTEGNIILENRVLPKRVISPETATIMNKLMQRVTNSSPGTGTPARFSDMPIAGKTGTSDNDYNQWFIGVTPYYVGVCWLGYDVAETINYSGYYYPPPLIWKNVMAPVHANLPIVPFPEWGNVVERTYCLESGNLAGTDCTETAVGWYKMSYIPPVCTAHEIEEEEEEEEERDFEDGLSYWRWLYGLDRDDDDD